jgi:hypothetical protein
VLGANLSASVGSSGLLTFTFQESSAHRAGKIPSACS